MKFETSFFDPPQPEDGEFAGAIDGDPGQAKPVYNYTRKITLAINVAMAADRPLLVAGPPGSGKTTLARNLAAVKGWRYLPKTITSRTRAEDLLAEFDALRRLNDSQMQGRDLLPDEGYVDPGVLWWAYDPADARWRGARPDDLKPDVRKKVEILCPPGEPGSGPEKNSAVVLLDEIDKAEPDVPNDLLEPLDRNTFEVRETGHSVKKKDGHDILVIITTNGERQLPPAFLRRCVVLQLEEVSRAWLIGVATRHYGPDHKTLYAKLADKVMLLREAAEKAGLRRPSTAEYLNSVRACSRLGITPGSELWAEVDEVVTHAVWKHPEPAPKKAGG